MDIQPAALFTAICSDTKPILKDLSTLSGQGIYPVGLNSQEYAALSLANSIVKKFHDQNTAAADSLALEKFLHSNALCAEWTYGPQNSMDEMLLNGFKDRLWRFFQKGGFQESFGTTDLVSQGRLGPGASLLARGGDLYTKLFDSPLSATSDGLYRSYVRFTNSHRVFEAAEMLRLNRFGDVRVVDGNRLSFVPKTTVISRSIATEPTLNMWFQLAAGDKLNRLLLEQLGIDIPSQPELNSEMARIGSIDGSFATIDLESASDSLSSRMLEWALPKEIFRDLSKYRSPLCTLPDGTKVTLQMFSSMGNGFTFPLQTVIFASAVCSVYHLLGLPVQKVRKQKLGNFGVFGDDIVCLADSARHVIRLLSLLGFRVNQNKSFTEGPFRESCGKDYFEGVNVRGVYLKDKSQPAILSAINLLVDFSERHNIPLRKSCRYLRKFVPWIPVPLWENHDSGIKTPLSFMSQKHNRNLSYAYKALRPVPRVLRFLDDRVVTPRQERRKRNWNDAAAELCFLAGHLRNSCIPIRHDRVRYKLRLCVAINWHHCQSIITKAHVEKRDWKRWESAFYSCL
jgi:hypothetical protein